MYFGTPSLGLYENQCWNFKKIRLGLKKKSSLDILDESKILGIEHALVIFFSKPPQFPNFFSIISLLLLRFAKLPPRITTFNTKLFV